MSQAPNFRHECRPYQRAIFDEHCDGKPWGLLHEQGLGKTKVAIDAACAMHLAGLIDAVLVVAPGGVEAGWVRDELPKHMWESVPHQVFRYASSKAKTKASIEGAEEIVRARCLAVLVMTYDGFMTDAGKDLAKKFLTKRKVMMVLDESQMVKNPNAKRTKTIVAAGKYAAVRWILSGTPQPNQVDDLYCVDPNSKVLTSDLRWIPAGDIRSGDELIGFDEKLVGTKLRRTTVEAAEKTYGPRLRIITDRGNVTCSANHRWVLKKQPLGAKFREGAGYLSSQLHTQWIFAKDLRVGDTIAYFGGPWEFDETRDAGWAAGLLDGEGCVGKNGAVACAQRPGPVLDRYINILRDRGFDVVTRSCTPSSGNEVCNVFIRGPRAQLRLLGSLRPGRLLAKAPRLWEGRLSSGRNTAHAKILQIDNLESGPLISIQTTTRTLVVNGFLSHNSQIRYLDPDFWKRRDIATVGAFRARFIITEPRGAPGRQFHVVIGHRDLDLLNSWLREISHRLTKAEALPDLPPKVYAKRYFRMTETQERAYRELQKELRAMVGLPPTEAEISALNPMVRMLRLQQIAGGYVPHPDDPEQYVEIDPSTENARLRALQDEVASIESDGDKKIIIWYRFKRDGDLICKALGKAAVRYDGTVGDKDREAAIAAFRKPIAEGGARYFCANPAAIGRGVTLNEASDVIYYSNSHNGEHRWQSEDRCHRIGQEAACVRYADIVAEGTVDSRITDNLRAKKILAQLVLGDEPTEWN